jgi:hypothetical protein
MGCSCGRDLPNSREERKNGSIIENSKGGNNNLEIINKIRKEKWKLDKTKLLNYFFEVFEKYKSENGESPAVKLMYSSMIKQNKDMYSLPDLFFIQKFSFIKENKNINWNIKPYSKIKQDIEDFFITNPDLNNYNGFDFNSINQLLPYESTDLELIFAKTSNFEKVQIEVGKDDIVIIILFSYNNYKPCQKIKELTNYLIENPILRDKVRIIPILNEVAYSKEDAKNKEDVLSLLGFLNFHLVTYVLTESNDNLRDYISWENEESSISLIFDREGLIRKVCLPSEIYVDDIKHLLDDVFIYDKKKFSEDKKIIMQPSSFDGLKAVSQESAISYSLWIKKNKIYSSLDQIKSVYYLPPHLYCSYSTKLGPAKEELVNSVCSKVSSVCLSFVKPITGKEIQGVISYELSKMKERNSWIEQQSYLLGFNVTVLMHRNYFFGKTKETELALTYYLNDENSLDLETLIKDINFLRAYPQLPKFGPISYQPEMDKPIPNLLSLHDENDTEDILDLSDITKPKAIFIVSYQTDDKIKFDKYKQSFWENIQKFIGTDGRYDLHVIYRGDSFDNAVEIQDHDMFKQKVFLWKSSNHDSDLRINVDKPFDYLVILLNKNNQVRYVGDLTDLDIASSLGKLLHDKPLVLLKNNLKNQSNFSDFKQKLAFLGKGLHKHFDELGFIYKPFVEFKYSHNLEIIENKDNNSIYHSFSLKLILKDVSKDIINKPDVVFFLKYFKNEFSGNLTIDYIETTSISDIGKCFYCPNVFNCNYPHFFDSESNTFMCQICESQKNVPESGLFHPTNLIYLSYENPAVLREIVKKYFEENKQSLNYLEGLENANNALCSICETKISSQKIVWYSMIDIFDNHDNSLPILLCDSFCFPLLTRRDVQSGQGFSERQVANIKMNCIDSRNLVYKKVIMSDTTMF